MIGEEGELFVAVHRHWPDEQVLAPVGKYCGTLDVSKKAEIPVVRRQTLHIHYVAPLRPSSVPPYSESSICWYKSFPTSCFQGKSRNKEPHLSTSCTLIAPIHRHWTFA